MKQIEIYQIDCKKGENAHHKLFTSMRMLQSMGLQFSKNDYKVVYSGQMDVEDVEDVYMRLQFVKPTGYKGHSLSISDVVFMDGKALFCDSYGFKDVTDMWT